jgi:hypothetical protein
MAQLNQFAPPANQADLTGDDQTNIAHQWSGSVNRWTETAILGNPWGTLFDENRNFYYNPLTTDVANKPISKPISWTAFPNRILRLFPNVTFLEQMGYAEGVHEDGTFGAPPNVQGKAYGPQGPRGWQDEYCEWIATRNTDGKIARVDFTCENPEYWFSLWRINSNRVLQLYQQLVSESVKLEDLYLRDSNNNPVIDRATALPAYNPVNKWNTQPLKGAMTGAVHLISPPNTLGAEIYLAAAATLLREKGGQPVTDPEQLITCSQYGTPGRNSDPHIGAEVNNIIIVGGLMASLQDPVGLYIQTPDFGGYSLPLDPKLPADADVSECWHIVRGHARGADDNIDFILHARFEIPQRWKEAGVSFTVSDIQINGNNIKYGAQITQTFQISLRGLALPTTLPPQKTQPCQAKNPKVIPWPLLVQDTNLFRAGTTSSAVTLLEQGTSVPNVAVLAANSTQQTQVAFTGAADVTVTVTNFENLPGQGPLPEMDAQLFTVTITAAQNAELGDRNLLLTNADGTAGAALPGMLSVVPPGTLAKQPASTERQATAAAVVTAPVPPATSLIAQSAAEPGDAAVAKWMAYRRNAQRSMSLV